MVYEVPASKASIKQNRFEFKLPGAAKTYSVPLLKFVPPAVALSIETEESNLGGMRLLFERYAPGVFDKLEDSEQLDSLFEAWSEASGISLGESSASAAS